MLFNDFILIPNIFVKERLKVSVTGFVIKNNNDIGMITSEKIGITIILVIVDMIGYSPK